MKIEVYKSPRTKEPTIYLDLQTSARGAFLAVVDEAGSTVQSGVLAEITEGGIELFNAVDPALGFQLDDKRRLRLTLL